MGKSMMVAMAKVPHLSEQAQAWCDRQQLTAQQRDELTTAAMAARVEHLTITEDITGIGDWVNILGPDGQPVKESSPSYLPALATTIRGLLHEALNVFTATSRETVTVLIDGSRWIITGGQSSGDVPTDAYEPINLIDQYEVTVEAISEDELTAAAR